MKHGLDKSNHSTDDTYGRTVAAHGFKDSGGVFVSLLLDVDIRFQQHANIIYRHPIHYHGEPLPGKFVALLISLVFQRQQPLLTCKHGPGLQSFSLCDQIPGWR